MEPIEIPIWDGKNRIFVHALVDADFAWLAQYSWYLTHDGYARNPSLKRTYGLPYTRLHHFVLNPEPGLLVSHKNTNKLDCRRENLENATCSANQLNTKDRLRINNKTDFRGVYFENYRTSVNKYRGEVMVAGKSYRTKWCGNALEAGLLLNELRKMLNVPLDERIPIDMQPLAC